MLKRKLYSAGLLVYCSLIITAGNLEKATAPAIKDVPVSDTLISQEPVFILPDVDLNPSALHYAKEYVKKNSWGLERLKKRSRPTLSVINSVFAKNSIPAELKYLAIVESNLDIDTVCGSSGATGIWQLMPETAGELGLKVTGNSDERLHVKKSSEAVAKYLKQLYEEFGDWLLVIAAYNSGPAKVSRAVQLSGKCDFWKLQNFLPSETRNHVKRFISVLYFFEELDKEIMQQNGVAKQTTSTSFSNNN